MAEIDKEYKRRGRPLDAGTPRFQGIRISERGLPHSHHAGARKPLLLPIRDIKGGTIDRDKKQEVVTDDML